MLGKPHILSLFPTHLINSTKHELSCKILYICNKGSHHVRSSLYLVEEYLWCFSGRVLNFKLKGCWSVTHQRHLCEVLEKETITLCQVLVQPMETGNCRDMTEKLFTGT